MRLTKKYIIEQRELFYSKLIEDLSESIKEELIEVIKDKNGIEIKVFYPELRNSLGEYLIDLTYFDSDGKIHIDHLNENIQYHQIYVYYPNIKG